MTITRVVYCRYPGQKVVQMPKYGALWTLCGVFQYAQVFLNVCLCFESH